jgi:hypothetical protein
MTIIRPIGQAGRMNGGRAPKSIGSIASSGSTIKRQGALTLGTPLPAIVTPQAKAQIANPTAPIANLETIAVKFADKVAILQTAITMIEPLTNGELNVLKSKKSAEEKITFLETTLDARRKAKDLSDQQTRRIEALLNPEAQITEDQLKLIHDNIQPLKIIASIGLLIPSYITNQTAKGAKLRQLQSIQSLVEAGDYKTAAEAAKQLGTDFPQIRAMTSNLAKFLNRLHQESQTQ